MPDEHKGGAARDRVRARWLGVYLVATTLLLGALAMWAITEPWSELISTIALVGTLGGLGSCLYSLRWYGYWMTRSKFDLRWTAWYVVRVPMGIMLGFGALVLLASGLLALGAGVPTSFGANRLTFGGVAFVAGMFSRQFTDKLEEIANTIFATDDDEDDDGSDQHARGS